jgi:hypothetical protein
MTAACRTTGRTEDDRRGDQPHCSNDHEDDPHCGKPEPVSLSSSDRPVHDGTRGDRDCAEEHSGQSHFLASIYLPLSRFALRAQSGTVKACSWARNNCSNTDCVTDTQVPGLPKFPALIGIVRPGLQPPEHWSAELPAALVVTDPP